MLLQNKLCFLLDHLDVYVHKVSPIKESKQSRTKYFNMVLQTEQETKRAVCYVPNMHAKFTTVEKEKSPVKLRKFKFTKNLFNPSVNDVTISGRTDVVTTEVDFVHKLPGLSEAAVPTSSVSDILSLRLDKRLVSFNCYLQAEGRPSITTTSKFTDVPILKKEVCANDNSGEIRVVLYGDRVNEIKENGVYTITNAIFRIYPNGSKCVNVSSQASVTKNEELVIEQTKSSLQELALKEFNFPPASITVTKLYHCLGCKKKFEDASSKSSLILKCVLCSFIAKTETYQFSYILKLLFTMDDGLEEVMMYSHQVASYFANKKMSVPADEDEIAVTLLSDNKTTIMVNDRNSCVGVQT